MLVGVKGRPCCTPSTTIWTSRNWSVHAWCWTLCCGRFADACISSCAVMYALPGLMFMCLVLQTRVPPTLICSRHARAECTRGCFCDAQGTHAQCHSLPDCHTCSTVHQRSHTTHRIISARKRPYVCDPQASLMADDFRMSEDGGSKVYSKQGALWCA